MTKSSWSIFFRISSSLENEMKSLLEEKPFEELEEEISQSLK
jgi:hypothetical protein